LTLVNDSGKYELIAVLTHKGRSADSGHYIGWVKQEDGIYLFVFSDSYLFHASDKWLKYDDEKVSMVNNEEIIKLNGKGGGTFT
jgi:ubiquitin carboxyl-terminal hydrolase 14